MKNLTVINAVLEKIFLTVSGELTINEEQTAISRQTPDGLLTFSRTLDVDDKHNPTINVQILLDGSVVYGYSGEYLTKGEIQSINQSFGHLKSLTVAKKFNANDENKKRFNALFPA